jgi:hypothetical protein
MPNKVQHAGPVWAFLSLLLVGVSAWAGASGTALITILEGQAQVIRGSAIGPASLGLALQEGDIVQTLPGASFVRVEFPDQVILDLGPDARVLLHSPLKSPSGGRVSHAYVLLGFAKLTAPASGPGANPSLLTAQIEVSTGKAFVLQAQVLQNERRTLLFAEAGDCRTWPRLAGMTAGKAPVVKVGQLLAAIEDTPVVFSERPAPPWLSSVPEPMRDNLPARAARVEASRRVFKARAEVSYGEVEMWLQSEPALRNALLARWKGRARDPQFRAALRQNLRAHPEWDRVLFPDKYRIFRGSMDVPAPSSTMADTADRLAGPAV